MRRRGRRDWLLAGLVAGVAHLALVIVIARWTPMLRAALTLPEPPQAVPVILWPLRRPERQVPVTAGRPLRLHRPRTPAPRQVPALPVPPSPAGGERPSGEQGRAPGQALGWPDIAPNLFRRIRPSIGCAHPEAYRLNGREIDRCDDSLGELAKTAPDLGAMTPPDKAAAFGRSLRCRRSADAAKAFSGPVDNFGLQRPDGGAGLRECGPGDN